MNGLYGVLLDLTTFASMNAGWSASNRVFVISNTSLFAFALVES